MSEEARIVVFTDGAAKGNPGPAGWGAVIVLPSGSVVEIGAGSRMATNNQMELAAAIEALRRLQDVDGPVVVYADSSYVLRGISEWIHSWRRRGWKTTSGSDVANREQWQELSALTTARGTDTVEWRHVPGHAGVPGNERADAIASGFAERGSVDLYEGPRAAYPIDVETVVAAAAPATSGSRASRARGKRAYSYLSVVDGVARRHQTWGECEARVKGRSGARYKKAMTRQEEPIILKTWGFTLDDL